MRTHSLIALVCLICLCILTVSTTQARTWHVPGDSPTIMAALTVAERGDVIEMAIGRHKIAGRNHVLPPGVTIRSEFGFSRGVVLEESACYCGDWRDCPVFVLDGRCEPVVFDGITFENFTLSCGPYQAIGLPIFRVVSGELEFVNCRFDNYFKTAISYEGGSGRFDNCEFIGGQGCASAVLFAGQNLELINCTFRENIWLMNCDELVGSILCLMAGETRLDNCCFADNGPLIHLVTVGPAADLEACSTCFADNLTMWEGLVEGQAVLDCCEIDPLLWHVVEGGELTIIDPPATNKAMSVETASWTEVKSLFQ